MEKLALLGGKKTVTASMKGVNDWPLFDQQELKEVKRVMCSSYKCYDEMGILEEELKHYFKVKYALSCVNGTAALHSGLFAAGIGEGDEVITPSYTYWATCMTILCANALPVFADIDIKTLNVDPADIERKITKRTKAIMLVHLWGNPCDMDAIMKTARKHKLKVIEDSSHAHGATLRGKHIGTIGDVGCFSMQASKNMPAIEGGFLLTNDKECFERSLALGHYGRLKDTNYSQYNNTCFGYKYRINPLSAAIARVQLRKLDAFNTQRNASIEYFCGKIKGLPGIAEIETPKGGSRVYYGFRLRYKPEELDGLPVDDFVAALNAEGAGTGCERYTPKHLEPIFSTENVFDKRYPWNLGKAWRDPRSKKGDLPETEKAFSGLLALPTFQRADKKLLDQYARAYEKVCSLHKDIPRSKSVKKKAVVDGSRAAIR